MGNPSKSGPDCRGPRVDIANGGYENNSVRVILSNSQDAVTLRPEIDIAGQRIIFDAEGISMDAKDATAVAKQYVRDLFAEDGATNIGLEEIRFDGEDAQWLVTIGFTRAWGPEDIGRWQRDGRPWPRTFKTVEISDRSGQVLGLRHWSEAA